MTITTNKGKYNFVLNIYLIYFIALFMLHLAAKKMIKVLRQLWSANSIIMWINLIWPFDNKTEENKQNKTKMQNTCFRIYQLISWYILTVQLSWSGCQIFPLATFGAHCSRHHYSWVKKKKKSDVQIKAVYSLFNIG